VDKSSWWKRLLRFQIANDALSVGGNLAMMVLLVGRCGLDDTLADLVSISCCSILNFLASDRLVFTRSGRV
jgi:putative flippase GtrA